MSRTDIRELIEFVQEQYSSDGMPERDPNERYEPLSDELNAIRGERPKRPDWLQDLRGPSVVTMGVDDVLSLGEELPTTTAVSPSDNRATIDTLAFYLPFHFYRSQWGIYLRSSGIVQAASELKSAAVSFTDQTLVQLAKRILFEHEYFHFVAETACSRAEVVGKRSLYDVYYPHLYGAPHEEAMANAHSFRKALARQPAALKKTVTTWMEGQGVGYRDFGRWLSQAKFREGCRRSASYMLQPVGIGRKAFTTLEPAGFLFEIPKGDFVPTHLVKDTKDEILEVLKPLPKYLGMTVRVYTREHPPPHFHIERPPGRHRTRYLMAGIVAL